MMNSTSTSSSPRPKPIKCGTRTEVFCCRNFIVATSESNFASCALCGSFPMIGKRTTHWTSSPSTCTQAYVESPSTTWFGELILFLPDILRLGWTSRLLWRLRITLMLTPGIEGLPFQSLHVSGHRDPYLGCFWSTCRPQNGGKPISPWSRFLPLFSDSASSDWFV